MSTVVAAISSQPTVPMNTRDTAVDNSLNSSPQQHKVGPEVGTLDGANARTVPGVNAVGDSINVDAGQQTENPEADDIKSETAQRQLEDFNNLFTPKREYRIEYEEDNVSVEQEYISLPHRLEHLVPTVRVANVEQFNTFFHQEDTLPIVQILCGGVSLKADLEKQKVKRGNDSELQETSDQQEPVQSDVDMNVLHRIRIHSPCILQHFFQAANHISLSLWDPHIFRRPFKFLIHFQPHMKKALEQLEKKWGELDSTLQITNQEESKFEETTATDDEDLLNSRHSLLHMRVYVKFMEEKVMPLYNMFRGPDMGSRKVLFTDLWYLFREGELVYSPVPDQKKRSKDCGSTVNNQTLQASYQNCWRVHSIITPIILSPPTNHWTRDDDSDSGGLPRRYRDRIGSTRRYEIGDDEATAKICCYYIDYNGESYLPVQHQFHISKFDGKRDIRSLPVYPINFANDANAFLRAQKTSGENFKRYIEKKHLYYSGWTLTCGTTGVPLDDVDKYPEHIEGQVIADFAEAYQTITSWKPEFQNPEVGHSDTLLWEIGRYKRKGRHLELVQSDRARIAKRIEFIHNDEFLSARRRGEDMAVSGDSLAILPKRLVVYSLTQRKFIHVNISCLRVIESASEVFAKLSINDNHKLLVRSLVQEHFGKKKRLHEGQEIKYQDFIKGKGTGLVFLLHGVPGVGKTATAEAVAEENNKPLFAITCGDLGFDPGDLEKNLSRIFRLANLWDCILLLDEADIFFTKRTPTDLQRNALVTVFLRILEYYSGILFLTTNRVGIIDEAFKSRIHVSLYYPPLDFNQYKRIFELNITRIKEIEAANKKNGEPGLAVDGPGILEWCKRHFNTTLNEVGRWNGRQIKNAFQVGASLAHYDLLDSETSNKTPSIVGSKPGILDAAQFDVVAQATREFDDYMAQTKKGTDSAMAQKDGVRNEMKAGLYRYHEASHLSGASPQYPGGRSGPGGPFSQPTGSPRYVASQEAYREQPSNVYYQQEIRRGREAYGQQLPPPQGPRQESGISPAYDYSSPSHERQGWDGRERNDRVDGPGGAGQPGADEGGHMYGKGAYGQLLQEGYHQTSSDARYERSGGGEPWRDGGYSNAGMGEMPYR